MSGLQRILSRVRIHGGDSGVSARATHHNVEKDLLITYVSALSSQADLGNVSRSTTERKKMSTKTSFKRIALVAVAALGMGVLTSVSPANATATAAAPFSITVADAITASGDGATTGAAAAVAGASNYVAITIGAATPTLAADTSYVVATSGAGSNIMNVNEAGSDSGTAWTLDNATAAAGTPALKATSAAAELYQNLRGTIIKINTPTAGTATVVVSKSVLNTSTGTTTVTALQTFTITVGAASVVGVPSATNSKSFITDSSTVIGYGQDMSESEMKAAAGLLTADSTVVAARSTTAAVAAIIVTLKDTNGTGTGIAGATLSATVTGPGLVQAGNTATDGANVAGQATKSAKGITTTSTTPGVAGFLVYSDNVAGVSTITITHTSATGVVTTIATETVTFYGAATAIAATQNLKVAPVNAILGKATASSAAGTTIATTYAATIKLTDANGKPATGTVSAVSSDATVIDTAACTADATTIGTYNCEVHGASTATSGKSATVTWQVLLADGVTKASATPVTFKIGGAAASFTWAFSKASYAPGEKVTATITAVDALKNPATDAAVDFFDAISGSVSVNNDFATEETSVDVIGGTGTVVFYAPLSQGDVLITATLASAFATSMAVASVTGSFKVGASTDLAALTTLVNSLLTKINAMQKLLNKIQKKLGVK